jgi:glucans biosynthesis protein C
MGTRINYLDASRAFALLLGVLFHASLSFMPIFIGWAVMDVSTSPVVAHFVTISHSFRMELFFLLAGFFSCWTFHRVGAGTFLATRVFRIVGPFIVGWFLLRPLLVSGWVMGAASLRGEYAFWPAIVAGFQTLTRLPEGLLTGTHLWFLYYLALVTAGALVLRGLLKPILEPMRPRLDAMMHALTGTRWGLLVLIVPTAVVLRFMRGWGMDTPDQTLVPHLPVLAIYSGCFGLGWLCGRQPQYLEHLARTSFDRWLLLIVGVVTTSLLAPIGFDAGHPHRATAHVAFVAAYACMMWSLVSLTLAFFHRFFSQPRAWVRYLADASYWLYLIHLPIVVWLQVVVAEWPLWWPIKLTVITLLTVVVGLLTYELGVRSTILGRVLNGRKRRSALSRSAAVDGLKEEGARSRTRAHLP